MAQHIWVKVLEKNINYEWNFADIYNLINFEDFKCDVLYWIDIYWDTIINKNNIWTLINELNSLKEKTEKKNINLINDFINFLSKNDEDLLFIWD
jgi:hypothetical protein